MGWVYLKQSAGGLEVVSIEKELRPAVGGEICVSEAIWNGEAVKIERAANTIFDLSKVSDIEAVRAMVKDSAWSELYAMHNSEKWSDIHYCCMGQLASFRKFVNELLRLEQSN